MDETRNTPEPGPRGWVECGKSMDIPGPVPVLCERPRDHRGHCSVQWNEDDERADQAVRELPKLHAEHEARKAAQALVAKLRGLADDEEHAWRWAGDGDDDLESMGHDMAVIITAGDLRRLIAIEREALETAQREIKEAHEWLGKIPVMAAGSLSGRLYNLVEELEVAKAKRSAERQEIEQLREALRQEREAGACAGVDILSIGLDTPAPLHHVLDVLTEGVGLLLDGLGWDGAYTVDGSGDHNDSYFRGAMRVGLAYLRGEPITRETLTTPAHPDAARVYTNGRAGARGGGREALAAAIATMMNDCMALGPCTEHEPCAGCMQLARLAGTMGVSLDCMRDARARTKAQDRADDDAAAFMMDARGLLMQMGLDPNDHRNGMVAMRLRDLYMLGRASAVPEADDDEVAILRRDAKRWRELEDKGSGWIENPSHHVHKWRKMLGAKPGETTSGAIRRVLEAQASAEHWRGHCKAVDALCDDLGIPATEGEQRILTEERVRRAVVATREQGHREGLALGYDCAAGYTESFATTDAAGVRGRPDFHAILAKDLRDFAAEERAKAGTLLASARGEEPSAAPQAAAPEHHGEVYVERAVSGALCKVANALFSRGYPVEPHTTLETALRTIAKIPRATHPCYADAMQELLAYLQQDLSSEDTVELLDAWVERYYAGRPVAASPPRGEHGEDGIEDRLREHKAAASLIPGPYTPNGLLGALHGKLGPIRLEAEHVYNLLAGAAQAVASARGEQGEEPPAATQEHHCSYCGYGWHDEPDNEQHAEDCPRPTHRCYACLEPGAPEPGTYCPRCEGLRQTTLACTNCGDWPAREALIPADAKPGDQCPCCYVPDLDCDGTLIDTAEPTAPSSTACDGMGEHEWRASDGGEECKYCLEPRPVTATSSPTGPLSKAAEDLLSRLPMIQSDIEDWEAMAELRARRLVEYDMLGGSVWYPKQAATYQVATSSPAAPDGREHELKTWPPYFEGVVDGTKTFEVRREDRSFAVGNVLMLREWDPKTERYTGRTTRRRITYLMRGGRFGLERGHVVLGLAPEESSSPGPDEAESIAAKIERMVWIFPTKDDRRDEVRALAKRIRALDPPHRGEGSIEARGLNSARAAIRLLARRARLPDDAAPREVVHHYLAMAHANSSARQESEAEDRSEPPPEYEVDGYTAPFGAFARVRPGSEPYDEFTTREEAVAACWAHLDAVRADLVAEVKRLESALREALKMQAAEVAKVLDLTSARDELGETIRSLRSDLARMEDAWRVATNEAARMQRERDEWRDRCGKASARGEQGLAPQGGPDAERWRRLVGLLADCDMKVAEPEQVAQAMQELTTCLIANAERRKALEAASPPHGKPPCPSPAEETLETLVHWHEQGSPIGVSWWADARRVLDLLKLQRDRARARTHAALHGAPGASPAATSSPATAAEPLSKAATDLLANLPMLQSDIDDWDAMAELQARNLVVYDMLGGSVWYPRAADESGTTAEPPPEHDRRSWEAGFAEGLRRAPSYNASLEQARTESPPEGDNEALRDKVRVDVAENDLRLARGRIADLERMLSAARAGTGFGPDPAEPPPVGWPPPGHKNAKTGEYRWRGPIDLLELPIGTKVLITADELRRAMDAAREQGRGSGLDIIEETREVFGDTKSRPGEVLDYVEERIKLAIREAARTQGSGPDYQPAADDEVCVTVTGVVASVAPKGAVTVEVDSGYTEDDADVRLLVWPKDVRPVETKSRTQGSEGPKPLTKDEHGNPVVHALNAASVPIWQVRLAAAAMNSRREREIGKAYGALVGGVRALLPWGFDVVHVASPGAEPVCDGVAGVPACGCGRYARVVESEMPQVVSCPYCLAAIVARPYRQQPHEGSKGTSEARAHWRYGRCRAGGDGDCDWSGCPQTRDGEPWATGRTCPLWDRGEDEGVGDAG